MSSIHRRRILEARYLLEKQYPRSPWRDFELRPILIISRAASPFVIGRNGQRRQLLINGGEDVRRNLEKRSRSTKRYDSTEARRGGRCHPAGKALDHPWRLAPDRIRGTLIRKYVDQRRVDGEDAIAKGAIRHRRRRRRFDSEQCHHSCSHQLQHWRCFPASGSSAMRPQNDSNGRHAKIVRSPTRSAAFQVHTPAPRLLLTSFHPKFCRDRLYQLMGYPDCK